MVGWEKKMKENGKWIVFEDVTKVYQTGETQIQALAGMNFEISEGEFVLIVGPSGAGKSTVLNILGGMDGCTEGRVLVEEEVISSYSYKELVGYRRKDIGFVFQFYNLIPNLTALENVEMAAYISGSQLDVIEIMESVGLSDRLNNFPSQLSGGEQQRVAIARALAKDPKLLLCDEPTGALDYQTNKQILKLLQDTCKNTGKTVIIISHNLALTPAADRVIRIKNGIAESEEIQEHPLSVDQIEW